MNNRRRKVLGGIVDEIKAIIDAGSMPKIEDLKRLGEAVSGIADEEDEATLNMPDNLFATGKYQDMLDNMCDLIDASNRINDIIGDYEGIKWSACRKRLEAAIHSIMLAVNR